MGMDAPATLRLLDKADREILALDRSVKGAVYDFLHKFRRNRDLPGLRLKQLSGSELFSARVSQDYRAILAKVTETEWLLLTVAHRSESYDDLEKYAKRFDYGINPLTGAIEFIDIVAVENSISGRQAIARPVPDRPLFADHNADELRDLGVTEALLPIIAKLTTDEELLGLVEYAPQLTGDILLSLRDGRTVEEVRTQILTPQLPDEPVDPHDFARALTRPATQVTTDDSALDAALDGQFSRWQVFLHPTQRRLVTRSYSGPTRVSGGPGTGKTIVALHRARHWPNGSRPGTTGRSCSPPSTATSPPTSRRSCWNSVGRPSPPGSTSSTSTGSPVASSTRAVATSAPSSPTACHRRVARAARRDRRDPLGRRLPRRRMVPGHPRPRP